MSGSAHCGLNDSVLGANVRRTRVYAWSANNSALSNLISSTETSVDGLHTWQTTYRDAATPVVSRADTAYVGGGTRYQTNAAPDRSYRISQYRYGRLVSIAQNDALGSQISALGYSYHPHGRQSQMTDARNGTTTYGYNNGDLVTSATTPAPGNGQNAQTTLTYYNSRLPVSSVTAPDGVNNTNEYYPSGKIKGQVSTFYNSFSIFAMCRRRHL